ncbi:hypothetical protein J5N97_011067 [Dioscorea zingiberensis]|uniref:Smr domain-containing protein n=1 Tax=Dioscorea zingiberensis TaxID=325984 RepID=A0A9D5D1Z6_9LILI|nr:hypothetical protein J5N97_011067 [Dioscorea zingiberensis]
MLRTKQLGTLSQCARSFLLGNSRCGSGDGASCASSEDEPCVSKRQSNGHNFPIQEKKPAIISDVVAPVGTTHFKNGSESVSCHTSENHRHVPLTVHDLSTVSPSPLSSNSSTISGKFKSVVSDTSVKGLENSPKLSAEVARAGMMKVGTLSDLVNCKIPLSDGFNSLTAQNSIVDSTQPLSYIRSSKGKSRNKATYSKIQQNSVSSVGKSSSYSVAAQNYPGVRAPMETGSMKTKQIISGISEATPKPPLVEQGQRHSLPQRAKIQAESMTSGRKSGGSISGSRVAAPLPDSSRFGNKLRHTTRSMGSAGGVANNQRAINNLQAVEQYYHTLQQLKWGHGAEVVLNNLQCKLDVFQANQVLKLLRDPSVALGFFNWLKTRHKFKHDDHTYTTMIGILGQAREFGAMRTLLEEMITDGCHPTVVTYNRLIHAYGRANYIGEAVKVFHHMQEAGCKPDRVTYCTLIDIHAKAGYLDVALDLYHKMKEVGLSPDTFTYSAMVNCLGKGGHLTAADKLFSEMIEKGCVPNLVTYNIMIALKAKSRNYATAVKLFRDMQAAGFRPDKITYNIVMEALGHSGHLNEVETVFIEMQRDWVPDEPMYGLLVDLWGKAGNVGKARAWYQAMLDSGLRPNVPTCNSLLSAYLRVHMFSDAYAVLLNMHNLGLIPSLQTYTLLLSCCTETQAGMKICCQLMAITGHPAHMFLLSLPDAEPGGQNIRNHAGNFLDLMHSEDRESKRGLVDAIIHFLHKSGLKEEAGSVWEVAAERNVYPDSVRKKNPSYWLINLHVMSEGTAITALSRTLAWFHRELLVSGFGPYRIDIVTGWGRRSRVTGSSLVRQSIQDLLNTFRFPFFTENGNSGCFVGCGEPLNSWLLNSYVERMHLL